MTPLIENSAALIGLWAVIGYLLGSIPFGIVLAKMMGLGNLRSIGSGNIGATNVLRTGNKTAAALTLNAADPHTFKLAAFDVLVLESIGSR